MEAVPSKTAACNWMMIISGGPVLLKVLFQGGNGPEVPITTEITWAFFQHDLAISICRSLHYFFQCCCLLLLIIIINSHQK